MASSAHASASMIESVTVVIRFMYARMRSEWDTPSAYISAARSSSLMVLPSAGWNCHQVAGSSGSRPAGICHAKYASVGSLPASPASMYRFMNVEAAVPLVETIHTCARAPRVIIAGRAPPSSMSPSSSGYRQISSKSTRCGVSPCSAPVTGENRTHRLFVPFTLRPSAPLERRGLNSGESALISTCSTILRMRSRAALPVCAVLKASMPGRVMIRCTRTGVMSVVLPDCLGTVTTTVRYL